MFGFAYASTMAMVWFDELVVGRLYPVWNCEGPYPLGDWVTRGRPEAFVRTHDRHWAWVLEKDSEQTRFACGAELAEAWIAGIEASIAQDATRTSRRRTMNPS
jgi:hypothetical protein